MKVTVRKDRNLIIVNARNTQNENDVETIEITVPEEYENFNKKIAFITDDGVVWDFIENNKYTLTNAITKYKKVKFYIWLTQDNKDFRSEERTIVFNKNQDANEEVTEEEISGFNKMINILEEEITEVTGLQEDLTNLINTVQTKLDNGDFKGDKGDKGDPGESYDDTEIKEEITDIKEEQTTQNTRIEELEEQVQELENNQLTGTATGQSIYIEDSTNTKVRSIGLSGNSEQESTTGKNKFDGNAVTTTHPTNWTISFENDILSITHNNSYSTGSPIANLGVLPQGTYIISGIFTREIGLYRDNSYSAVIRNGSTFSANGSEEIELYFSGSVESGVTDTYKKLQIELGSTATAYEPYTGGQASPNPSYPQEIHSTGDSGSVNEKVQNKNLCNSVTFSGSNLYFYANAKNMPRTFTLSFITDVSLNGNSIYATIDNTNLGVIGYAAGSANEKSKITLTLDEAIYSQVINGNVLRLNVYKNNAGFTILKEPQIEQGTTATDYIAHEEQNISFPLSEGQKLMEGDYLADDGIHHVMKETRLGSNNNFYKDSSANGFNRFIAKCADMKSGANNPIKCSHLVQIPSSQTEVSTRNKEGIASSSGAHFRIMLVLNETDFPNKEALNTWLSNNNVKLQYPLAEEVIDPYTEEQQAVWEQIKALRTYKPVTHISSTDEVPATVDVTYVKDLETVINNLGGA